VRKTVKKATVVSEKPETLEFLKRYFGASS